MYNIKILSLLAAIFLVEYVRRNYIEVPYKEVAEQRSPTPAHYHDLLKNHATRTIRNSRALMNETYTSRLMKNPAEVARTQTDFAGISFMIASEEYSSSFDSSSSSFCMHAFNIPQTFIECEKIGMRPCCSISSEEMKRASFIDPDGYVRLASNLNTCVKYHQESSNREIGLSISDPAIEAIISAAVKVTYDPSSFRRSGTVDDGDTVFSFAGFEDCSPGSNEDDCTMKLSDIFSDDTPFKLWSPDPRSSRIYMDAAFPANVTKTTQETVGRKVSWQITKGLETLIKGPETHGVI